MYDNNQPPSPFHPKVWRSYESLRKSFNLSSIRQLTPELYWAPDSAKTITRKSVVDLVLDGFYLNILRRAVLKDHICRLIIEGKLEPTRTAIRDHILGLVEDGLIEATEADINPSIVDHLEVEIDKFNKGPNPVVSIEEVVSQSGTPSFTEDNDTSDCESVCSTDTQNTDCESVCSTDTQASDFDSVCSADTQSTALSSISACSDQTVVGSSIVAVPKQYDRYPTRHISPRSDHLLKAPIIPSQVCEGSETNSQKTVSPWSVSQERHPPFLHTIVITQMKAKFKEAEEPTGLLRPRRTIYDDFEVIANRSGTDGNKRKSDDPPSNGLKRSRTNDDELKIVPAKGRFVKMVLRREKRIAHARLAARSGLASQQPACSLAAGSPLVSLNPSPNDDLHSTPTEPDCYRADQADATCDPTRVPYQPRDDNFELLKARHNKARGNQHLPAGSTLTTVWFRPPIKASTLEKIKVLDLIAEPQVRHDLINPNPVIPMSYTNEVGPRMMASQGLTTTEVGMAQSWQHVASLRRSLVTWNEKSDMYWKMLEVEVQTGCRCGQWITPLGGMPAFYRSDVNPTANSTQECLCGRWLPTLTQDQWQDICDTGPYRSRIKPMLHELREMIQIVMPGLDEPTSQSAQLLGHPPHIGKRSSQKVVERFLHEFDVKHVVGTIRNGAFDYDMFRRLGSAIKGYCDKSEHTVVDSVIQYATSHVDIVGVKKLFEFMRTMKVDLVNDLLHRYIREWLVETAPYHELPVFETALVKNGSLLENSDTQLWIHAASQRVLQQTIPDSPRWRHLMGACTCRNKIELVIQSIIEGSFILILSQWHRRDRSNWKHQIAPATIEPYSPMPESMHMDVNRISQFALGLHVMAAEATILWAVESFVVVNQEFILEPQIKEVVNECLKVLDAAREADYNYLHSLSTLSGAPAAFIISLAKLVLFYDGTSSANANVGPPTPADSTLLHNVSLQLKATIAAFIDRTHPQYQLAIGHMRQISTEHVQDKFLRGKFDKFASMFPAPESDCQLADKPLLSERDVRTKESAVAAFDRPNTPIDPNRIITKQHLLRWNATIHVKCANRRKDLLGEYRLKPLAGRIHDFSEALYLALETHFLVYRDIYLSKGMMVGSGSCSLFDMRQSRTRRQEANMRNLPKTLRQHLTPSTVDVDPGHIFGPWFGR